MPPLPFSLLVAFSVQSPSSDLGSVRLACSGVAPVRVPLLLVASPPLTEQLTVQVMVALCPLSGLALAVIEIASGSWISVAKPQDAWDEDADWHCWLCWPRAMLSLPGRASAVPVSALSVPAMSSAGTTTSAARRYLASTVTSGLYGINGWNRYQDRAMPCNRISGFAERLGLSPALARLLLRALLLLR